MTPKRVNVIKWSLMKMKWEARLRSIATFKGVKDYEEWAMSQSEPIEIPPHNPIADMMRELEELSRQQEDESQGWVNPEDLYKAEDGAVFFSSRSTGNTEKDRLWNRAVMLRKQINDAIDNEDFEKAQLLKDTLDVIEKKYNEL